MGEIIIRSAKLEDARGIQLVTANDLGIEYPPDKTAERLQNVLLTPFNWPIVAELDGEIVGFLHLTDYICTYSDPILEIKMLAVAEKTRRRGVGSALVRRAEEIGRENGYTGIRLVSGESRTARTNSMNRVDLP